MDRLRLKFDIRPATRHLLKVLGGLWLALLTSLAAAQVAPPGRPLGAVIDEYVREGLASNLSLKAQSLEVERSAAALDAAQARYFPEVVKIITLN